jgi:hypothetical protein
MVRIPTPVIHALQFYGVVAVDPESPLPLGPGLSLVTYRDIAAITSDAPYSRVAVDDARVASHRRVVESVFEHRAILPAPVGTVFRSRDALMRWLELHYFTFTEAMQTVDGTVMGRVTARFDNELPIDQALPERPPTVIAAEEEVAASFQALRRRASACISLPVNEPRTRRMSYLVPRDRWKVFRDGVRDEQLRVGGATLSVSGPWPPYDFIRMQFGT